MHADLRTELHHPQDSVRTHQVKGSVGFMRPACAASCAKWVYCSCDVHRLGWYVLSAIILRIWTIRPRELKKLPIKGHTYIHTSAQNCHPLPSSETTGHWLAIENKHTLPPPTVMHHTKVFVREHFTHSHSQLTLVKLNQQRRWKRNAVRTSLQDTLRLFRKPVHIILRKKAVIATTAFSEVPGVPATCTHSPRVSSLDRSPRDWRPCRLSCLSQIQWGSF